MNQGEIVFFESTCALRTKSYSQFAIVQRGLDRASAAGSAIGVVHDEPPTRRTASSPNKISLEQLQVAAAKLLEAIDNALLGDREAAAYCIHQVGAILYADPVYTHPMPASAAPPLIRGGLAPWQIRRIAAYIDANLGMSISTEDLAKVVRLSPCHFSRAFRESFSDSPHKYVMRRRVERAQGLMLTTAMSLGQIAVECGLADQAHLCKLFLKIVGESPGMWRRARVSQPA